MNFLVAIVLLFTFPGTFAAIRGGQADGDTSDHYERSHRQLSGTVVSSGGGGSGGGGGGSGSGMNNNPTPTQMNTPIRRPTRRPTKRPTKTPTSSPVQPPSVDLTLFVLGTVTFSTAGSTYNPTLFIGILQSILVFLFNGAYLNLINNVSIKLLSVISRTPTQADTTSQVTTFEFTILVPTLDLDELPDSPDYDDFIIDTTEDFINFFGLTITTALFQNFVFGALSSAQNSFTSVNTVTFDPVEFPPTPA